MYKYLKCNYKHANFLETIIYFQWILSFMYDMKKNHFMPTEILKFLLSLSDEKSL